MSAAMGGKGCSPSSHKLSPCWLYVCLNSAPDLTSLLQLMAPDQPRSWNRVLLAALQVKFHCGDESAQSPDKAGFNRICDEHKLSFM